MNPPDRHIWRVAGNQAGPGRARRAVTRHLSRLQVSDELIERTALALSELAANAVEATPEPFTVDVEVEEDGAVTLAVTNSDPDRTAGRTGLPGRVHPEALRGRGLSLVDAVADQRVVTLEDGQVHIEIRLLPHTDRVPT